VPLAADGGRDEFNLREVGVEPGGINGTAVRADRDRFLAVFTAVLDFAIPTVLKVVKVSAPSDENADATA